MKKISLALVLAFGMVLCLISCGGQQPKTNQNANAPTIEDAAVEDEMQEQVSQEPEKKAAVLNKAAYPIAEDMAWTYEGGVLTVSGNGRMPEYKMSSEWPWKEYSGKATKIVIEEGIQSVGQSAFYDFYKVKEVVLPSSLKFIDTCGFCGCSSLPSVVIPEGTLSVGESSFDACFEMASVTLPSTLLRIEENGFSSCDEMTSIVLPEGLEFLGESVFYSSPLTEITLPSSLIEIGKTVFTNSYNLKSVTLNCEVDMPNIFSMCDKIENVNCGSYYVFEDGVLYNKDKTHLIGAFDAAITEVNIPESVTSIGADAFSNTNLASVTIPASVKKIGDSAFISCKNLTSVTIENGVENIGRFTFAYCDRLSELNIPESVKGIEYGAFRGCTINVNVASSAQDIDFDSDDFSHATITVNYAE